MSRKPFSKKYELDGKVAKQCSRCKEIKTLDKFTFQPTGFLNVMASCAQCERDRCNTKNALRTSEYRKQIYYKNEYGITIEDYNKMFMEQNGVCAICRKESNSELNLDHNHITNKIRALLCDNCNVGLGNFQEDIIILYRAVDYLRKWETND